MSRILRSISRGEHGPSFGFRVWRGSPQAMKGSHAHTDLEWNCVLSGAMQYFLAGRFQTIPAGRLGVFWGGVPHQLTAVEAPCECIWVTLPLAWFLDWQPAPAATERLLRGELLMEPDVSAAASAADLRLLGRWQEDLASGEAERRRLALLEVEARLGRLVLATGASGTGAPAAGDLRPVERAAEYIGGHYTENDLAVDDVARAVGLHPSYLMTLFRRHCGMTLWEYVTRLRVASAQRRLLTGRDKVLTVALDSGFGSAGRFYEAFRRYAGASPRAYRHGGEASRRPEAHARRVAPAQS